MQKMRQRLIFKINSKGYEKDKYSFQNDSFMIDINNVDIEKIVLSTKTPYGNKGANKYYVGYLNDDFKEVNIVIKDAELCANNMHILAAPTNFLKYIKIWSKITFLFNRDTSKNFTCDTEYIKPKICQFNENRNVINKIFKKSNYYGTLILSIDSICKVAGKLYPQTFLKKLFECNNNTPINKSSDESNDESNN